MSRLFWFKAHTFSMLHDIRVKKLEHIRNGMLVFGAYVKLYALACELGDCGRIYISDETPYTATDFAKYFNVTERVARFIFDTLVEVGLIFIDDMGFIKLLAWDEEQAAGKGAKRPIKKTKTAPTEKEKELELEKELEKEKELELKSESESENDITRITKLFNTKTHFKKINSLTFNQQAELANAIKRYGVKAVEECVLKAEQSDFLAGRKGNGFKADFDWIIAHIDRILSGSYDDYKQTNNANSLCGTKYLESSIIDSEEEEEKLIGAEMERRFMEYLG